VPVNDGQVLKSESKVSVRKFAGLEQVVAGDLSIDEFDDLMVELERLRATQVDRRKDRIADLREQLAGTKAYLKRKQDAKEPNQEKIAKVKAQLKRIEGEIADLQKEVS
jgi:chromosome segregation ATPase